MNGDTATSRRRREDEKESVTAGITDISDLALQSSKNQRDSHEDKSRKFSTKDSSPLQLPEDKRLSARDMTPELELSLSPTNVSPFSVELNKSSHEYYLPDNPLVKSDMDPDYKDELDILKSQLQMQKRELSEEDSKLKMAEADSTIDSLHLQDNGWECEIPGSRLEKTSGQPSTLLSKAIGNIKENDNLKRKSRDREEHLSDDGELIKKKKKKKRKEETDSESAMEEGEERDDSEESEKEEEEDEEEGEESDSSDERRKKKKKESKKKRKKREKEILRKFLKLNSIDKNDLNEIFREAKRKSNKKKKKKKRASSEMKEEKSRSPSEKHRKKLAQLQQQHKQLMEESKREEEEERYRNRRRQQQDIDELELDDHRSSSSRRLQRHSQTKERSVTDRDR